MYSKLFCTFPSPPKQFLFKPQLSDFVTFVKLTSPSHTSSPWKFSSSSHLQLCLIPHTILSPACIVSQITFSLLILVSIDPYSVAPSYYSDPDSACSLCLPTSFLWTSEVTQWLLTSFPACRPAPLPSFMFALESLDLLPGSSIMLSWLLLFPFCGFFCFLEEDSFIYLFWVLDHVGIMVHNLGFTTLTKDTEAGVYKDIHNTIA